MMNMSHAKKAQALASDLDYRQRLHDYTVNADDIKVQQAKKAYNLQSEVRPRSTAQLKFSFEHFTELWSAHLVHVFIRFCCTDLF